jgi:hypothetical protein
MIAQINKLLNKPYPQNYILRKPVIGALIFLVFCFAFALLYRPLKSQAAQSLSYAMTMAIYFSISSVFLFGIIKILKSLKYFSETGKWNFIKELISIFLVLSMMGVVVYILGFFVEAPAQRWNLKTFLSSYLDAFLIGIIPFGFFTLSNYRHLFVVETVQNYKSPSLSQTSEEIIQISSTLKKEELSFYPSQFVYAESDGNYVVFYLTDDQHTRKEIIRNSISNIEQQLSKIPYIIRTHRAFIVNLKRVQSKKGNTLGYQLNLDGAESVIPVSRQHIHHIDELLNQYR